MTPEQVQLVRSSFAKIVYRKDEVGLLFYDRLFTIAPEVRPLFKSDVEAQSRKLMDTLAVAVNMLRDKDALLAVLADLGRRHRGYGVEAAHYAKVGEALLWTLEKGLGPAFDAPTRAAWVSLYATAAGAMQRNAV